jgi:hypothetical protein
MPRQERPGFAATFAGQAGLSDVIDLLAATGSLASAKERV